MGIFLALLSCVFSTAKDLISKRVAHRLDGTVSTFASFAYALPYYLLLLGVLYALGFEPYDHALAFFWLVLLRSITDTFAEGMKMYAFAYGDISVVSSFFSLSPLFLLLASPILTGDETTIVGGMAVVLVVAGSLVMVYRPPAHDWASQKKGIALALAASFFFALNSCFDRLAMVSARQPEVAGDLSAAAFAGFTMTLCSALFLTPLILAYRQRRQAVVVNWPDFAVRGFLETTFMVCKLEAVRHLQAPYVAGLQRVSLLLSIIGGRVLFQEEDFVKRLIAGFLIMLGVLLIVLEPVLRPLLPF